jgi:hypothetical protein
MLGIVAVPQDGEGRSVSAPLRLVGLEWYPTASIYSY